MAAVIEIVLIGRQLNVPYIALVIGGLCISTIYRFAVIHINPGDLLDFPAASPARQRGSLPLALDFR